MISYLEITKAGGSILGFKISAPASLHDKIREAVYERIKTLTLKAVHPVRYGYCDTCGLEQQDYQAGECPLCTAAKLKIERDGHG